MKILHLIFSFTTGGAETMLIDIVNRQCQYNKVFLIVVNNKYDDNLLERIDRAVDVVLLNRREGSKNPIKMLYLNYLIWKLKPNVIHCHNEGLVKLLLNRNIPICRTIHSTGELSITPISKKYDRLISISVAVDEDLNQRIGIRSTIVANGIVCDDIKKRRTGRNKGLYRIVQVSRVDFWHKGQDILVEAIHLLSLMGIDDICVDFIGEGKSLADLKSLIDRYNLSKRVSLLGNKSRSYIYSHLCDYDLFVQPSRFEGFGLTVVEAMSAMVPVLVSDIEGPMEIIENGKYGFFFNCEDPKDCADKIKKIHDGALRTDVEANYRHVKEKYDISNTVSGYQNVYEELSGYRITQNS